jgi:metallo-beta-lactamase family protein
MESLRPLGAAKEVTGSANLLITNKGNRYLIDYGMFQGREKRSLTDDGMPQDQRSNFQRNKEVDPALDNLSAIFITHAHLDHIGRLPLLYKSEAPIYMTPATYEIAGVALRNAAKLSRGLYPPGSVEATLKKIHCVEYDRPIKVNDVTVTFRDAGHILGSASIEIQEENGDKIVFSGDLGNSPSRIVRPTALIDHANILVTESTYGNRLHSAEDPSEVLLDAYKRISNSRGTLLIPGFAIDRTQIMLNLIKGLHEHSDDKIRRLVKDIPVYLDSPMAIDVTEIYKRYKNLLNDRLRSQDKPFHFERLEYTRNQEKSMKINAIRGPKVIIAGSGMMNGGRIGYHALRYLPDPRSVIMLVGYTAEGTPSRAILDKEKTVELEINGNIYDVSNNLTVLHTSSLSAHADQNGLRTYAENIYGGQEPLRDIVVLHGDDESRVGLRDDFVAAGIDSRISLPKYGEIVNFHSNGGPAE